MKLCSGKSVNWASRVGYIDDRHSIHTKVVERNELRSSRLEILLRAEFVGFIEIICTDLTRCFPGGL
jgi:hypothetical protein